MANLTLCQTNPATGACISPGGPQPQVTVPINTNETPTFSIFVNATGAVPFDPAHNRIFVRFSDANHVIRGETRVAVRTQ